MRNAGDKIALQTVQPGLFIPENKNQAHPGQNNHHQKAAFKQNHPVKIGGEKLGLDFLGKLLEPKAVFYVPVNPDCHKNYPGDLNANKNKDRVKY